jgi:hypothetical protein
MNGGLHEGGEIAGEEVVVEEQIVGEVLVGSLAPVAGDVVASDDRDLRGEEGTPRMASWV